MIEVGPGIDPALEAAYDCRTAVPDHPAILDRWREASAAVRNRVDLPRRLDLPYGHGRRHTLDLFGAVASQRPRPLLILLHGGGWQAMDKGLFSLLAPPFVTAGGAVAVLNYPQCPDEPLEAIAASIREAVRMLWHQAAALGLDRRRFVVAGHGAGGHLVAEMLSTHWPNLDPLLPRDTVRGGIAISGLFDLEPLVATSLNRVLGLDADAARRNSPLWRDPVPGTSLTLAVGERESAAFHWQSIRLARDWAARGVTTTWVALPGRHHFSALEALAEPDHPLFRDALARLSLRSPTPVPLRASSGVAGW